MCKPHYFLLLKLHDKERNHSFNYMSVLKQCPVSQRNDEALWHFHRGFSFFGWKGEEEGAQGSTCSLLRVSMSPAVKATIWAARQALCLNSSPRTKLSPLAFPGPLKSSLCIQKEREVQVQASSSSRAWSYHRSTVHLKGKIEN